MRATRGLAGLSGWRCCLRHWPIVGIAVVAMLCGALPVSTARGQAFVPQPPADAPHSTRADVCRPPAPAVEKTPGQSVRVDRGPAECNAVHFSFDAGADRGYVEMILDVARDEHVQLSFGMTGRWARQNPDLMKRIVDEGRNDVMGFPKPGEMAPLRRFTLARDAVNTPK